MEGAINRLQENLKNLVPAVWQGITLGRLRHPKGTDPLDMEELSQRFEILNSKDRPGQAETRQARKYLIEQLIARGFRRKEDRRPAGSLGENRLQLPELKLDNIGSCLPISTQRKNRQGLAAAWLIFRVLGSVVNVTGRRGAGFPGLWPATVSFARLRPGPPPLHLAVIPARRPSSWAPCMDAGWRGRLPECFTPGPCTAGEG